MKKKKKMKKRNILIASIIIILLIGGTSFYLLTKDKKEDKPKEKKIQTNKTVNDQLENSLKEETYYIEANLNRYLAYAKGKDLSASKIVADVNSNLDKKKYEDTTATNVKDDNLMLVNKYFYLTEDYEPNDLITLTAKYNTGRNSQMRKEAANAFMEMSDAATVDNVVIKNASAYRTYKYQVTLYNNYVERDGKTAADTYSARPGFSEHQTGLATDINQIDNSFENTDAFRWLQKNAYKYGFILRFPKDKEDITGYQYEPWHYRYVGTKVAKQIHDENLTLEEYYAYYIQNKNS